MDIVDAASSGDHLKLLIAMRARIAEAVSSSECPPRDLSSLTRRLQEIAKEIDSIEGRERLEGKGKQDDSHSESEWDPDGV